MSSHAAPRARRLPAFPVPAVVLAAIAVAWALALLAEATGRGRLLQHDALLGGDVSFGLALAAFLLAWQAMVAAMMLPSSLPLIGLFARTAAAQPGARTALAAFLGGYAVVWGAFGWAALVGDALFHAAVERLPELGARPGLVAGGVLVAAGAFQFTGLKDRCLTRCRNPGAFLLARYRRGARAAFRVGRDHGLSCLGCCWALMLVLFALGMANLAWMAGLMVLTVLEKTAPWGARLVPVTGAVLIVWGTLAALGPAWLPGWLAGPA
jgi:predicted metal-binding membrane protein